METFFIVLKFVGWSLLSGVIWIMIGGVFSLLWFYLLKLATHKGNEFWNSEYGQMVFVDVDPSGDPGPYVFWTLSFWPIHPIVMFFELIIKIPYYIRKVIERSFDENYIRRDNI